MSNINLSILKASLVSNGKYSGDLCFCPFVTEDLADIFDVEDETMQAALYELVTSENADFVGDLSLCGTITFYEKANNVTASRSLISDLVTNLNDNELADIVKKLPAAPTYKHQSSGVDDMDVIK